MAKRSKNLNLTMAFSASKTGIEINMTEQEKIDLVAKATGMSEDTAEAELIRENWDVDMAIWNIREQCNGGGT